jgi:phospholipid-binding lipoprotein MlaA
MLRIAALFFLLTLALFWSHGVSAAAAAEKAPPAGSLEEGLEDDLDLDFDDEEETLEISDSLEPVNRAVFWFNDKFYFYLLKPVVRGYRVVIPERARISVKNFFSNLFTPVRMANSLLQGKVEDFGNELGRFMVNTTIGVGGLFDPAKKLMDVGPKQEDFGQTLGTYGVGPGFYCVLPFIGPSSSRDAVGMVGDFFMDPLFYLMPLEERLLLSVGDFANATSLDKDTYESIKRQAVDPYLFIRNAYFQKREGQVKK